MTAGEPVLYAVDTLLLGGIDSSQPPPPAVRATHWSGIDMDLGVVRGGVFTLKEGPEFTVKLFLWGDETQTKLLRTFDLVFTGIDKAVQVDAPIWVPFVQGLWISGVTSNTTAVKVEVQLFVQKACIVAPC